jgi:hypothetical protein
MSKQVVVAYVVVDTDNWEAAEQYVRWVLEPYVVRVQAVKWEDTLDDGDNEEGVDDETC